jgi:hypothetical protein
MSARPGFPRRSRKRTRRRPVRPVTSLKQLGLEISSACFWLHGTPLECHQIFVHGFVAGDAGHSRGPALRDAVASTVATAADFERGSVVVTISEVPADKMKPIGSSNQ